MTAHHQSSHIVNKLLKVHTVVWVFIQLPQDVVTFCLILGVLKNNGGTMKTQGLISIFFTSWLDLDLWWIYKENELYLQPINQLCSQGSLQIFFHHCFAPCAFLFKYAKNFFHCLFQFAHLCIHGKCPTEKVQGKWG